MRSIVSVLVTSIFCAGLLLLSGCGGDNKRIRIKGSVKYNGQPVNKGFVYLNPDSNNPGPQGVAEIKGGAFDTQDEGKGAARGLVTMRVEAFDGKGDDERPNGKPLFVFEKQVELQSEKTIDLDLKESDVKQPGYGKQGEKTKK